ncbi:MAG: ribosomal protein L22 [Parcubacteria bacterium C7867-002]|nr:MAG: ribosomal protein L22 [Parcubacteria bacterium C7867-002]
MITASLKNHRIAPRKVRLVADMIRGKKVVDAQAILAFALKKAKSPLGDLLNSAIANAQNNFKLDKENLYVKEIMVNQGYVLKRSMPVSRGSAHPIKKRTSHVRLVLAAREPKAAKKTNKSTK